MRAFRSKADFKLQAGFQAHHVLPVAVFSGCAFGQAFALLRADGFDPRSFKINGLLLPGTEDGARRSGRPLHRGPHRRYNGIVSDRVSVIICEMNRCQQSHAARIDAIQRLGILIAALRQCLSGNHSWIYLNSRDPLHSKAAFGDLDGAVDILWLATK